MHFSNVLLLASVLSFTNAVGVDYAAIRLDASIEERGFFSDAIDKVQDGIENLGDRVTSVVGRVADRVTSAAAEATEDVGDAVERIVGGTDRVADALKNALQDLDEEASSKIHEAAAEIESFGKSWQRELHFSESLDVEKNERIFDSPRLAIDCFDCQLSGGLEIDAELPSLNEVIDILQGQLPRDGAFTLNVTIDDFTAHLNMSVDALIPGIIPLFSVPLIVSPVLGPNIGGLVGIGPQFGVDLSISMTIDVPVTFTTGFDFKFEKSSVALDILDLDSSSKTGFASPQFTPQEFTAKVGNVDVTFSIALVPFVSLGLVAFDKKLGVSLNLQSPKLAVTFSELDDDVVCERFMLDAPFIDHNILVTPEVQFNLIAAVDLPVPVPVIQKLLAGITIALDPQCSIQTSSVISTSISSTAVTSSAYTTAGYAETYVPSQPSYSTEAPYSYTSSYAAPQSSSTVYTPIPPTSTSTSAYQTSETPYIPPYGAYSSTLVTSYAPPQYTAAVYGGY